MEYIHEERNVLSKTLCHKIIEKFESDSRRADRIRDDRGGTKCTDLNIEVITGWGVECTHLNDAFNIAFTNYIKNLKLNVFGEKKEHIAKQLFDNIIRGIFTVTKYDVGGHFNWHIDDIRGFDRICNFIIYLNDHEACTEFLNGKKIKPEAGKIVFFPSTWTYSHCGQSVEKNAKYIIASFIHHGQEEAPLPFLVTYD